MSQDEAFGEGGDSDSAALADVAFLARSENRVALLDALGQAPADRRTLAERTAMSTPTLARILQEFEKRGWIERDGDRYRATATGALLVDGIRGAIETTDTVNRLAPFLRTIPEDSPSIDPAAFSGARVTVAEPGAPLAPIRRFVALSERSETLREINPTSVQYFDADVLTGRLDADRETELIYEPGVIESLRTDHSGTFDTLVESPVVTLLVHESIPFGLSILEDRIGLCGYDRESGALAAFVESDGAAARRWAETVYERYRREALSVTAETTPTERGSPPTQVPVPIDPLPSPLD